MLKQSSGINEMQQLERKNKNEILRHSFCVTSLCIELYHVTLAVRPLCIEKHFSLLGFVWPWCYLLNFLRPLTSFYALTASVTWYSVAAVRNKHSLASSTVFRWNSWPYLRQCSWRV